MNRARRTLAITLTLTLAGTAGALAAGPLNGKTYEGSTPSYGINEYHERVPVRAGGNIILRVARNGRSVSVRFSSSHPVLYCNTLKALHVQSTKSASISGGGTFRASINERFAAGPGAPAIVQVVTGRFSGRHVSGTIYTNASPCSGSTAYSATAR
jgi:hypothetical protein